MPDNVTMASTAPATPVQFDATAPVPPPQRESPSYATTVMLLPTIIAIGGALVIDIVHYNDGLSLLRRTPHWWRMVLHMILYIAAVAVATGVGGIALCGYSSRLGVLRRRVLFVVNVAAVIGGWFLCQPRFSYAAGVEAGYAALDFTKLEAECATMPALIAKAPIQRNYLFLCADAPSCKQWWPLLPPYVASLDPRWIYIEPDRVVLVLDYRFIELQTVDNGLYIPLTDAAKFPQSPSLHAMPAFPSILRLDNDRWERFRTDTSPYPVFPDAPTPVRDQPSTKPTRREASK